MDGSGRVEPSVASEAEGRPTPDRGGLTAAVLSAARDLGFASAGIATDAESEHLDALRGWLAAERHGEMAYLERQDALERRGDLRKTLGSFRSAIVVTDSYHGPEAAAAADDPSRAIIARYARGADYHEVLAARLRELHSAIEALSDSPVEGRVYVDTGPILERELGRRAGLGWFGKNTMLIHPGRGSYFFLGVLLLDVELAASSPFADDHCGTCRACLDACPTGALLGYDDVGAPIMDARRCISYLTIELKGPIPVELRPLMGNRVFGCDICQEVCPWNEKFAEPTDEPAYSPRAELDGPSLVSLTERLLAMSGKQYQRAFSDSPLSRPGRRGMLRNLCVALGNSGADEAVPVLTKALEDPQPLVREHAAWALGRIGSPAARAALSLRLKRSR